MVIAAAAAKSLQSCPTLCDPIDGSPPGSSVPGILQARTLEWVAISFSNAWKGKVKVKSLSCVQLFATPWSAAYQAPPSMGFSRWEYWSGLPLPSPPWANPCVFLTEMFFLSYVNETMYLLWNLPILKMVLPKTIFSSFLKPWADKGSTNPFLWQGMTHHMPFYLKNAYCGRGA